MDASNTTLFSVEYLGFTAMDRLFSRPMMPWVIAEIRRRAAAEKVRLGVCDGCICVYNDDSGTPMFQHSLQQVMRFSHVGTERTTFLYILRDPKEPLLYCFLYRAKDPTQVVEFFNSMKEHARESSLGPGNNSNGRGQRNATSLGVDISPTSSHFFEVLYIGKIKVSHKKVPDSFIDDALEKFRLHELEKGKAKSSKTNSNNNLAINCTNSQTQIIQECEQVSGQANEQPSGQANEQPNEQPNEPGNEQPLLSPTTLTPVNGTEISGKSVKLSNSAEAIMGGKVNCQASTPPPESSWMKQQSLPLEPMRSRASSTGSSNDLNKRPDNNDHNRTMVFQVGRIDLRLISPDRKQILLHKNLKDVASCIQGIKNADHFGFICREPNVECYVGYVFKCQSESFADDVVGAITQAFLATSEVQRREKQPVFNCDHCPMVWFHKLCSDVEGVGDKRTQNIIFRRVESLPEEEQSIILAKFRGAETSSLREQNEFLMMLLRAHCESKQIRHVHDTPENRSEFLNQYLGGSTIFMKAKKSLTSSFDQLLKRKGSRDDFGPIIKEISLPMNATLCKDSQSDNIEAESVETGDAKQEEMRPRSSTLGTFTGENVKRDFSSATKTSPMMNIFLKVGNSPKTSPNSESTLDAAHQTGSWRQAIFNRVVSPNKSLTEAVSGSASRTHLLATSKREKSELRALWRKAINQQLLLIRMEKENARLRARQEEATVKRIKLEYDEIGSCVREVMEVWELLVSKESRLSAKCDSQMLLQAIRQGVPRGKRGEVWQFLAEQFCMKHPPVDTTNFPNYHVPYDTLLRQLTSHQHGILIDLGRTFPNHTYFSSPLGPGQLALFNLLKAYSLLDPEVGYCQGLSFVAGVLLLHMSEEAAFLMLRHLMFHRGLRRQYLPDMVALQVQLYQLSRLLHDQYCELYAHFDQHEVAPTLYAAPWILTVFASQFPLGFVTRVFDLMFLESPDVIFRFALALLEENKDGLLICDSFEEIMEYLKFQLPNIDKAMLDRIIKQVFNMDISKQLHEYEVEYHVLQEEMSNPRVEVEEFNKLEQQNKILRQQLQIATSNMERLDATRTAQQVTINRLEAQIRSLEVSVEAMGHFIASLADTRKDIDIPGDVRRIVSHLTTAERRKLSAHHPPPIDGLQEGRNLPHPLKTALSSPNLGAKLSGMSSFFGSNNQLKNQKMNNGNISTSRNSLVNGNENTKDKGSLSNVTAKLNDEHIMENKKSVSETSLLRSDLQYTNENENLTDKKSSSDTSILEQQLKSSECSLEISSVQETVADDLLSEEKHPLDSCSGINFTYGGTTKLRTIRPVKPPLNRNSSVDSISNKKVEAI